MPIVKVDNYSFLLALINDTALERLHQLLIRNKIAWQEYNEIEF
jgi:hypothetical protein